MLTIYESLGTVVRKADSGLVVKVDSVSPIVTEDNSRHVDFAAVAQRIIFGNQEVGQRVVCRYSEYLPHRRGEMEISPLASGSGLETDLEAGAIVILLLDHNMPGDKVMKALRVEPVEAENAIKEARR